MCADVEGFGYIPDNRPGSKNAECHDMSGTVPAVFFHNTIN
jgi:hypothetical protein